MPVNSTKCLVKLPGSKSWAEHYNVLKAIDKPEWLPIDDENKHINAYYAIPEGTKVKFIATANAKPDKIVELVAEKNSYLDFEVYTYGSRVCGWLITV